VEKRLDPSTGQNIYVRYLADKSGNNLNSDVYFQNKPPAGPAPGPPPPTNGKAYDIHELIYSNHYDEDDFKRREYPPIIIRQEKTPSPIIVEKYIKKKSPQVIIKEIHVHEPAPPPIKVVEKLDDPSIFLNEKKFPPPIYDHQMMMPGGGGGQQQPPPVAPSRHQQNQATIQYIQHQAPPPPSAFMTTNQQQPKPIIRNFVCHTTYETQQGDTLYPRLANNMPAAVATPANGNYDSFSNFNEFGNSIPSRRPPPLKDINYYLNNPAYTTRVNRYTYNSNNNNNNNNGNDKSHQRSNGGGGGGGKHYDEHHGHHRKKERALPRYGKSNFHSLI
jgi:hypothetical protein